MGVRGSYRTLLLLGSQNFQKLLLLARFKRLEIWNELFHRRCVFQPTCRFLNFHLFLLVRWLHSFCLLFHLCCKLIPTWLLNLISGHRSTGLWCRLRCPYSSFGLHAFLLRFDKSKGRNLFLRGLWTFSFYCEIVLASMWWLKLLF